MPDVQVEWLHATTVHALQTAITAIRNDIHAGRTMAAMDKLRRLSAWLDLYRLGSEKEDGDGA